MSTATSQRRVSKVTTGLSVLEIVLADLRERHRHLSFMEYAMQHAAPSTSLCDRVEAAVEREMKGSEPREVRDTVRKRCHEALFLVNLVWACETCILQSQRADAMTVLAEMHEIQLLRMQFETKHGFGPEKWLGKLREWRRRVLDFAADRTGLQLAVDAFQDTYFAGQDILFADSRESLSATINLTERLAGIHETLCLDMKYLHKVPALARQLVPIELKAIEKAAKAKSGQHGRLLLDTARIDGLRAMGMGDGVDEVLRPYLKTLAADRSSPVAGAVIVTDAESEANP
jgi:hypothetical protein